MEPTDHSARATEEPGLWPQPVSDPRASATLSGSVAVAVAVASSLDYSRRFHVRMSWGTLGAAHLTAPRFGTQLLLRKGPNCRPDSPDGRTHTVT